MPAKPREALLNAAAQGEHSALLAIEIPKSKEPPGELRLFKMGENDSTQGKFLLTQRGMDLLMQKAKDWGNKFHLDWDHHAALAMKQGVQSPAAAWYHLEARDDGLYAAGLSWTAKGRDDVQGEYYKYISPWFDYEESTREIVGFVNAALTNLPSLKQVEALASIVANVPAPKPEERIMDKAMLSALGLAETATASEVAAKVAELKSFKHQVLTSTGAKSDFEAMSALLSMRAAQDQSVALLKQLEAQKEEAAKKERDALLTAAVEAGQLEPGGDLKKQLESQPVELVKAMLSSLPKKTSSVSPPKGKEANELTSGVKSATLSKEQVSASKTVARIFDGMKAEDIQKHHQALIDAQAAD